MTQTRFTKGPWVLADETEIVSAVTGALVVDTHGAMGGDDTEADAALICAAPLMYKALEQAVTSMQDSGYSNSHCAVVAAKEALRTARGETQEQSE